MSSPKPTFRNEPDVFRQDRRKLLSLALIGVAFVVLGVSFITQPELWKSTRHSAGFIEIVGWLATLFFSACLGAIVVSFVRPVTVKLGPEGITVSSVWRTYSRPWNAVDDFRLWQYKGNRTVVYNDTAPPNARLAGINRELTGATSGLPSALNVDPEQLLAAVEAARARWHGDVRREPGAE